MVRKILPGNYVNINDSYNPVGVANPPFVRFRICGFAEIGPDNTAITFPLVIPSVNNTDPDKKFPAGFTIPAGAYVLRYGFRVPDVNTDGDEGVTLSGTNGHQLILGPSLVAAAGATIAAASNKFGVGPIALDARSPSILGSPASILLRVANGAGAAGVAPVSSKGTLRLPWEIIYEIPDDVINLEHIPNGNK